MLPLLAALAAAGIGAAAYNYGKKKQKSKDQQAIIDAQNAKLNEEKSIAQNVYNYNNLTDSTTGNTLFNSQQKTKRTIFGTQTYV